MREVGREHEKSMIYGTPYKQVWVDPPGQATGARSEDFNFERQRKFPLTTYGSVHANPPHKNHTERSQEQTKRGSKKKGSSSFSVCNTHGGISTH